MCQNSLVGLGAPERTSWLVLLRKEKTAGAGGEAHYYCIATEELRYGYAGDANRARDDSCLTVWRARGEWITCIALTQSNQSSSGPAGRPASHPTATGWDEELRARTAGVRLPRQGHSESSFRRIHPYVRSCSATGTDMTRGPESVRDG